ncbi:MAG: Lrp/AsnC family transcriptional regulator [Candidatus Korarchaeum sp.]|nr:Lrp/AsnC family transcriptional regulator [Candidatus Korarchaeum sp.]MDW8035281.1 Lrp/AsnC family transcriptional regulator [Candidatus Korarchaeum sp.]
MDELDRKILSILVKNARTPFTDIADQLGVSEATVRKRVDRLVKIGVIRKFTIELGDTAMRAVVLIKVKPGYSIPNVAEEISGIEEVVRAYEVTGDYDIIAEISSSDTFSLNKTIERIRSTEGVGGTLSMIVLAIW